MALGRRSDSATAAVTAYTSEDPALVRNARYDFARLERSRCGRLWLRDRKIAVLGATPRDGMALIT